jgi:dTDP-4-amino-4,6-dideoxygalactose transaminase
MNISQETLAEVLDDEVTHVVAIDQFGSPAPVEELEELTGPLGIPILVDAACSIGASVAAGPCGCLGRAATFSFHPRKIITTGEGGAVVTNDDALAAAVRRFRNIGIEDGTFHGIGLNLRPSEMGCAMGVHQLHKLDEILEIRRALARRYQDSLPMLRFQAPSPGAVANHQTLAATLPQGVDRDALRAHLSNNEVESQVASYSIHRLDRLARKLSVLDARTPHADRLHDRAIALPLHQAMTETDVDRVVELVAGFIHR